MANVILTAFNFRILDWDRSAGVMQSLFDIEEVYTCALMNLIMNLLSKSEADAGDAASTSSVKVPGGHK